LWFLNQQGIAAPLQARREKGTGWAHGMHTAARLRCRWVIVA
jgi:hypothetical protein